MSIEFVFWFILIKRRVLYFDRIWNNSRPLIKVVVNESRIRSDDPITDNYGQNILEIHVPSIKEITWEVTSPGTIGYIKIITHSSEHYYLTPANPLDPTLTKTNNNIDELIAFCNIVNALRTNHTINIDENPYIRQSQTKAKPAYLDEKDIILWDKNLSPWNYYYEFVPASEEKKRQLEALLFKIFVLGGLTITVIGVLYGLYINFR